MNLVEKWKNRETKKKLREENIKLKTELEMFHSIPYPPVCTIERNLQQLRATHKIDQNYPLPIDYIKKQLAQQLIDYIYPFIDWDICDGYKIGEINVTGCLYIATGDSKHGN